MLTRKQLVVKAKANVKVIEKLKAENIELLKQSYLLSDKRQQYKEELMTVGRGKNKREELRGMITWKEIFTDQDTGGKFTIQRHTVVKINGQWLVDL